jgi:hypothetical protein
MNASAANPEHSNRWSEWLLWRNRRGMRSVLWIVEFFIRLPRATAHEAAG